MDIKFNQQINTFFLLPYFVNYYNVGDIKATPIVSIANTE